PAEPKVAVGDIGSHGELGRERERLAIVPFGLVTACRRRDVARQAERVRLTGARAQPAGERQRLPRIAGRLVDPPRPEIGRPRAEKNERRPAVSLATAKVRHGAEDERQRLAGTSGQRVRCAKGGGTARDPDYDLPRLADVEGPLEDRNRVPEISAP